MLASCRRTTVRRYRDYIENAAELYNRIDVDDFEYMEKLGEGAFGKVVRKSSYDRECAFGAAPESVVTKIS